MAKYIPTDPGSYINRDQRNIHIWGTSLDTSLRCLVGGCFQWLSVPLLPQTAVINGEDIEQRALTNRDIYGFVRKVLVPPDTDQLEEILVGPVHSAHGLNLPSEANFRDVVQALLETAKTGTVTDAVAEDDNPALLGQYLFFLRHRQYPTKLISVNPTLKRVIGVTRTISQPNSGSKKAPPVQQVSDSASHTSLKRKRNAVISTFRTTTRMRDALCKATGVEVPERKRGDNYHPFNVAHIYPRAWMLEVNKVLARRQYPEDLEKRISKCVSKFGNTTRNSLLLLNTMHSMFDDYQLAFGFRASQRTYKHWGYQFEQGGALGFTPGLPLYPSVVQGPPLPRNELLLFHFDTAVFTHFAGFGQQTQLQDEDEDEEEEAMGGNQDDGNASGDDEDEGDD
uniref:HNH nuclease domain-containing protein n=1 Tax=Mycena chlorophos TaxID=658473 RepID=A0ABQ0M3Z2_MYCCL|nr:predicted protein [Mycena chlorophos]